MLVCIFSKYEDCYFLLLNSIKQYIPLTLIILEQAKIQCSKLQSFQPIYTRREDLYNICDQQYLNHKNTFFLCDNEDNQFQHNQIYSILIRIQNKNEIYFETKDFKRKGKCTDDFISETIFDIYRYGYPTFAFKYNDTTLIFKGASEDLSRLPLYPLQTINNIQQVDNVAQLDLSSNKTRVIPMTNWTTPDQFINHLNRFKPKNTNIEFTFQNPEYGMVVNSSQFDLNPTKTIYFMMEPKGETLYKEYIDKNMKGTNNTFLLYGSHENHLNLQEYWLTKTYEQLLEDNKDKHNKPMLSVCVSDRYVDPGHIYRLDLIKKLDKLASENKLPFEFHIYGKCKSLGFKQYKGECPERNKENSVWKYKYHFNAENHQINNYITEKFHDALMSECYLFYLGAPNVKQYFDGCCTVLSGDIDTDIETIIKEINENIWETTIHKIREVKRKTLIEQNVFNRVSSILTIYRTIFCRIYISNEIKQPDINIYQKDGWHMVTAYVVPHIDSNYTYLKQILSNLAQHNTNIVFSFEDNYNIYDKICFKCASNEKSDIIKLNDDIENKDIFAQSIFIKSATVQKLNTYLNSTNIPNLEKMLDGIIIN